EQSAHELARELGPRAIALQADVTDPDQVARLFSAAQAQTGQPILSVVNNALVNFRFDGDARPDIETISWSRIAQQLEGATRGALNTIQAAIPEMKRHG